MLYVVGIGPGNKQAMTNDCQAVLEKSDIIVGYTKYIELIAPLYPNKQFIKTKMTQEVKRCKLALSFADKGENVCVVCSGDAGIYGMAGLIYELSVDFPNVDIQVVSGITAALSGSALLGSPLGHDFCVISLSDLLTPYEVIEKRLEYAATADFCIVLYNPSSKNRSDYLSKACNIMLQYKSSETVCGSAKNIGRIGECFEIMTLLQLHSYKADMFTTIFIGNSQTKIINNKMITPRGYNL